MSAVKKVLIVVAAFLLLLAVTAGVLVYLISQDDNKGLSAQPSVDLLTKGVVAAGTGQEVAIEPGELNGFLAYLFSQRKEDGKDSPLWLEGMYLSLGEEEGDAGLYLPCTYRGQHVGVTARARVAFDAQKQAFCIQVNQLKAGRMNVPVSWALTLAEKHLPEGVTREGDSLWVDASKFSLYIEELGSALRLESFRIEQGRVYLRTTGVLDSIQSYMKEKLGGLLGDSDLLNDLVDDLGGKFSDFLAGLQTRKEESP